MAFSYCNDSNKLRALKTLFARSFYRGLGEKARPKAYTSFAMGSFLILFLFGWHGFDDFHYPAYGFL